MRCPFFGTSVDTATTGPPGSGWLPWSRARAWTSSAWLRSLISRPLAGEAEAATATEPTWFAVTQSGVPSPAARVRTGPRTRAKTRLSPPSSAARTCCIISSAACSMLTSPLPEIGADAEAPTITAVGAVRPHPGQDGAQHGHVRRR